MAVEKDFRSTNIMVRRYENMLPKNVLIDVSLEDGLSGQITQYRYYNGAMSILLPLGESEISIYPDRCSDLTEQRIRGLYTYLCFMYKDGKTNVSLPIFLFK